MAGFFPHAYISDSDVSATVLSGGLPRQSHDGTKLSNLSCRIRTSNLLEPRTQL